MDGKVMDLYYTSDLHGFFYPTDYRSSDERDMGLFKCANRFEKSGNTLIIDGGDILQGSPFSAFCHDSVGSAATIAEIMNRCGYDYVTLGNHDFNFGKSYLLSYLNGLKAQCVCENVHFGTDTPFSARIHTLENGLRVGLVGIVTDYVNIWERPEHLQEITVTDPLQAARSALERIRDHVDLTVCVYHGGFEQDLSTGKVLLKTHENIACRLCRELDFDILLTGHQHMFVPGQILNGTFVVQPMDSGKEFVHIRVKVDSHGKQYTSVAVPAGGECQMELIEEFADMESGAQSWLNEVVGHLSRPLIPMDPLEMAVNGNGLADFFNIVQLESTGAQLSATSMANEISGIPQTVRRRDVLVAYPYTNTVSVLEIDGNVLRKAVERSAEYFAIDGTGALCISERFLRPKVEHYNYDYFMGIDYTVDASRPVGARVVKIQYQGTEVKDSDRFTICLNSYRASGAGGYAFYQDCPVVKEINIEMSDLILEYFRTHPDTEIQHKKNFSIF